MQGKVQIRLVGGLVAAACSALICSAVLAQTPSNTATLAFLAAPGNILSMGNLKLVADSYPEALPNDGRSESTISVLLTNQSGEPLAGVKVNAHVDSGDGYIPRQDAVTDERGNAVFTYRAGTAPVKSEISVVAVESGIEAQVQIPLAPVTYLDLTLMDPIEYKKYRDRQTSAAPIYRLELGVFPDQLAADGGSLSIISATLLHADGKPAPGVPLQASLLSGEGSVNTRDKATDSTGKMSFYFVAGRTPGTATVRITEPSTGLSSAVDVLLVESGPCRLEIFYLDPLLSTLSREGAVMPADGISGMPMLARVTDLSGLPMAGVELRIEMLDNFNGWLELLDPVSDAAGEVAFTYHSGTSPGKLRLRAFAASGME